MKLILPNIVEFLLGRLQKCGYEAYVVGGCVRDLLRGEVPADYDLTTSAHPEEVKQCFADFSQIEIGIRHGTVGIVCQQKIYEVTTYRMDSTSVDHRHPDVVSFTPSLRADLSRRDFTINAMAFSPTCGLVDFFEGQADLQKKILRTVGDPHQRFEEDALRILRGLRFSSVLGFSLEAATITAMEEQKHLLQYLSKERVWEELQKLLCGKAVKTVLRKQIAIIGVFLPELLPLVGMEQYNPYHSLDVFEHTLKALDGIAPLAALRWAMLLHDCGKATSLSIDERGVGHFYGHSTRSANLASAILTRFRAPNEVRETVVRLIKHHDDVLDAEDRAVKRYLNRFGAIFLRQLLEVQRADVLAQAVWARKKRLNRLNQVEQKMEQLLAWNSCFSLRQLAISGNDLLSLGLVGMQIGWGLNTALQGVLDECVCNERVALLDFVCKTIDKSKQNQYDEKRE